MKPANALGLPAISRGAIIAIGLEVSGMVLAYLSQVALARWMGPTDYGRYAFVVAFSVLCMVPLQLGFDIGLMRFLPSYRETGDHAGASGFLRRAFGLPLGLSISVAVVVGIVSLTNPRLFGPYAHALAAGMLALPLLVASSLALHAGRALGRFALVKSAQDIIRPLLLLSAAAMIAWTGTRLTAPIILIVSAFTVFIAVIIQARWLSGALAPDRLAAPRFETRRWLLTCLPFLVTTGTAVVMQQTDVLMLGFFRPPAEVGIYAVAARLGQLVTLGLMGVNMLGAPAYAALHARGAGTEMQLLARRLVHLAFWPAVVIAAGLAVLGSWLLSWFGAAYTAGYAALMIIAAAGLVDVAVGSVGYLANMADMQWTAARIRASAALANVLLNSALIPYFGLVGAACGTAFSIVLANLWLHRRIRIALGLRTDIWHNLR